MNTTVSKSFGLALLLAVGILAVMVALGTFSAQKVGADIDVDTTNDEATPPIVIVPNEPGPGAGVQVIVAFHNDGTPLASFEPIEITLEGWDIPDSIDTRNVQVRQYTASADIAGTSPSDASLPVAVTVTGQKITVEVNEEDDDGTIGFDASVYGAIVFRQAAGLTAPTEAGKYDVTVKAGDEEVKSEELVTVSPSLKVDPKKGGGATEVTVSGKAFANGTATLYTEYLAAPDTNNDGILDTLIIVPDSDGDPATEPTIPSDRSTEDYTIDIDGDGEANYDILHNEDGDGYVAVTVGSVALGADNANVETLVSVGGNPSTTEEDGSTSRTPTAPTLPTTSHTQTERLKDVAVSDGAFSTTISAGDLVFDGPMNRSQIRIKDADGFEARAQFQVTGTMSLGADSVGKGKTLKISLADWIIDLPDEVKIGGTTVAKPGVVDDTSTENTDETAPSGFLDEDGDPLPATTTNPNGKLLITMFDEDGVLDFYVKVSGEVGLGTKSVVLFASGEALAGARASVEITAVDLTVSPSTALVGREITVTGSGFTDDVAEIKVGKAMICATVEKCDIEVASGGRVVAAFDIPNKEVLKDADDYTVTITDTGGRVGNGTVTIPEPTLTVDPLESRIGSTINLSGTGWPTGTGANLVGLYYDGDQYASAITDSSGEWSASIEVPHEVGVGSTHDVEAKATVGGASADEGNVKQKAEHSTPDAVVTLSAAKAQRGTNVTVSGENFNVFETVMIEIGESNVTPAGTTTDGIGSFSTEVVVPGLSLGNKNLKVTVNNVPVVEFLEVVSTPVVTTMTVEDAFGDLIDNDSLTTVWRYDFATRTWTSYTTDPETSFGNDLFELDSGDILYVHVSSDQSFSHQKGETLMMGWSLITLN